MAVQRSGLAIGAITFAAVLLFMVGVFQVFAGLAGILEDEFYLTTQNYIFEFDATTWGWTHLIWGIILVLTGLGLFSGNALARTAAVFLAALSAMMNFAFIPLYPIWSIVIIAVNVLVIWALVAHGRDVVQ